MDHPEGTSRPAQNTQKESEEVTREASHRARRLLGAGAALTAAAALGVTANQSPSNKQSERALNNVSVWFGGQLFPSGTKLLEKPDDQAVASAVPEGQELLATRFQVISEFNQQKKYAEVYINKKKFYIDLSIPGVDLPSKQPDKNRRSFIFEGNQEGVSPHIAGQISVGVDPQGKIHSPNPNMDGAAIGDASLIDKNLVEQELKTDHLKPVDYFPN